MLQKRSAEIKSTTDPREKELARLEAEQAAIEAEEARLVEQQA
ncbi:hypothetical protein [Salipaludibacillus sp. LMS25]|nr:hypothetical protein [Salipaludibacillus sp. LMS25]